MTWEWKELCGKDHMHRWERSAVNTNLVCTAEPRDTPESVDAYEATITDYRNYTWSHVKRPLPKTLAAMVADAKKEISADIESSVLADLPRNPVGFSDLLKLTMDQYDDAIEQEHKRWLDSPFYKIMREKQTEICLLYGTMTNYFLVMQYKPQQRT